VRTLGNHVWAGHQLGAPPPDTTRLAAGSPVVAPAGACEHGDDRSVLRRRSIGKDLGGEAPPIVAEALRRPGRPLDAGTREAMEAHFGQDLSRVRVHTDPLAAKSAETVRALAYTLGPNVLFAAGRYRPTTPQGRILLGHELVHVLQQGDDRVAGSPVTIGRDSDSAEVEARQLSSAADARIAVPAVSEGGPERLFRGWISPDEPGTRAVDRRLVSPRLQRTIGDGHDLTSNRFKGNQQLEAAFDAERTISFGDRGLYITILQQALVDARFSLPTFGVYGFFGNETEAAVRAFQASKGLTGAAVDGIVNATTMGLLDQHFVRHAPERALASHATRPLLEGTRALSPAEKAAVTAAITTEPRTTTGALPVFNRVVVGIADPYEVRVARRLNDAISGLHSSLVASRPPRTPGNLMTGAEINRLARRAKADTDAVFGRYRPGRPALSYGVNITDQFVERHAFISATTRNADWAANFRVMKLLDGDPLIRRIDEEHGAVKSRTVEWALIAAQTGFPNQPPGVRDYNANPPHVTGGIVGTRRAELLAIHENWPASAGGGVVHLRRSLGTTNFENRNIMYRTYATIIHEYVHTLEATRHERYRGGLPEQRGGYVLREGMTDYFAKVVWDGLTFNAGLRATIEGRFQDPVSPNSHPIPSPPRYQEWVNAERAVGIVGIRNAMAAFFLGRTGLIGGP
jgi:hypothetical protein